MSATLTQTEIDLYRGVAATAERLIAVIGSTAYLPRETTLRELSGKIADDLLALTKAHDCPHPPEAMTMRKDGDRDVLACMNCGAVMHVIDEIEMAYLPY